MTTENGDRLLTRVELSVGLPTVDEITRIVDAFFDANPLSTAYEVIHGDEPLFIDGELFQLTPHQERRYQEIAVGIWWLAAARKRLDRPD